MENLIIYHGSQDIIEKPEYGKGKPYNDYGLGFYCTKVLELAKEWSCTSTSDGYVNKYILNTNGLKILNLQDEKYTILHWITLLLKNRTFEIKNEISAQAKDYLIKNYDVDISKYDVIIGYRADDSYFSFAQDFLNNGISVQKLAHAMKLGNLGEQIVIISKKAFNKLQYVESEPVSRDIYYKLRASRDKNARDEYINSKANTSINKDDLFIVDIIRGEIKEDDSRL